MADVYIKYTPVRRGLTGAEFLPSFLDENHPGVTFDGFISDSMSHYGILSGVGDSLGKSFLDIEGRFSVAKLDEDQFIGICKMLYVPAESLFPEDGTALTFIEFMDNKGVTVTDELASVKKAKRFLFKESIKRFVQPNNDNISALTKAVVLHLFWYDTLSAPDKAQVDADTAIMKAIYNEAMCVGAYHDMVTELQSVLGEYYTAVTNLESQTTVEDAEAVQYPAT